MKNKSCTTENLRRQVAHLEQQLRYKSEKLQRVEAAQNMLNILTDIQSQFITDGEPRPLFNLLLTNLLSITKSEYGFIGEVFFNDDQEPYLKTHAITNIAWNEQWEQFYQNNAPDGMVFANLKTLFGAVMTSGRTVISNDPAKDPRRGGLPEGHPALNSFLGLPIAQNGKLLGMIGIANRPYGYDEELVAFLKPFAVTCAGMITSLRNKRLRMKAEEALHDNEVLMQGIVNTAVDAIITIDKKGNIHAFNRAAENLFGYSAEDTIGKKVNMLMPSPYCEKHDSYLSNYLETGKSSIIGRGREVIALRKDKSTFPAEMALSEVNTLGQTFFTGILRDITDRKDAEARKKKLTGEIRNNHENLLAILNKLRLGTATIDADGRVTFMNSSCANIVQNHKDESITGRKWDEVFAFEDQEKELIKLALESLISKKKTIITAGLTSCDRKYLLEIEIHQDPRRPKGAILFIYDMTEIHALRTQLDVESGFHGLIGKSEKMQRVFFQLQNVSGVDSTVLIQGETGTGKELAAKAIHEKSERKGKPFIAVNCAGFTHSLIATQLFGHRKGAFTGAIENKPGVFEAAHGGTVFLDEIGEIPLALQANLLRVLQEKEVVRTGESKPRKIDVRIISATNVDLQREVKNRFFRNDLYYRLHVASITLPPLRERTTDIPLLVNFFLNKLNPSSKKLVEEKAMRALIGYNWPGNVRELENSLEAALISSKGNVLLLKDLPEHISGYVTDKTQHDLVQNELKKTISPKEQRLIEALKETRGNRVAAAKLLGIGRTTLYRQIKQFGLTSKEW